MPYQADFEEEFYHLAKWMSYYHGNITYYKIANEVVPRKECRPSIKFLEVKITVH